MRSFIVKRSWVLIAGLGIILAGCGGGGGGGGYNPGIGSVSGVVYDQNGNIVRNAQVFFGGGGSGPQIQTVSNSNGAYILNGLPAFDDVIQC